MALGRTVRPRRVLMAPGMPLTGPMAASVSRSRTAGRGGALAGPDSPSGKLVRAAGPRMRRAAASYARAASSAVSNVPSHTRCPRVGSRISAAHFPHGLWRTPLYWVPGRVPVIPAWLTLRSSAGEGPLELHTPVALLVVGRSERCVAGAPATLAWADPSRGSGAAGADAWAGAGAEDLRVALVGDGAASVVVGTGSGPGAGAGVPSGRRVGGACKGASPTGLAGAGAVARMAWGAGS